MQHATPEEEVVRTVAVVICSAGHGSANTNPGQRAITARQSNLRLQLCHELQPARIHDVHKHIEVYQDLAGHPDRSFPKIRTQEVMRIGNGPSSPKANCT